MKCQENYSDLTSSHYWTRNEKR